MIKKSTAKLPMEVLPELTEEHRRHGFMTKSLYASKNLITEQSELDLENETEG